MLSSLWWISFGLFQKINFKKKWINQWTHKFWPFSNILHSTVLYRLWVMSRGHKKNAYAESDWWWRRQRNPCFRNILMMMMMVVVVVVVLMIIIALGFVSKSTITRWRHRILRHCSRSTTRGHAGSVSLYHLSRLRT